MNLNKISRKAEKSKNFIKYAELKATMCMYNIAIYLQRKGTSRSVQSCLRGAAEAAADAAAGQETLENRDTPVSHLLHRLPQSRSRGVTPSTHFSIVTTLREPKFLRSPVTVQRWKPTMQRSQ